MTPEQRLELARAAVEYAETQIAIWHGPTWSATARGGCSVGPPRPCGAPSLNPSDVVDALVRGDDVSAQVAEIKAERARLKPWDDARDELSRKGKQAEERYIAARKAAGFPDRAVLRA